MLKFTEVTSIPRGKGVRGSLLRFIDDYVASGFDMVKVEFDPKDYKSTKSAAESLRASVKRSGYNIKVMQREDCIYLRKM